MIYFLKIQWQLKAINEKYLNQLLEIERITKEQKEEIMNQKGYGVVSLYHTLIEPLRNKEFGEAWDLSKCILNLPIHQDVDTNEYPNLVHELIMACKISKDRNEV